MLSRKAPTAVATNFWCAAVSYDERCLPGIVARIGKAATHDDRLADGRIAGAKSKFRFAATRCRRRGREAYRGLLTVADAQSHRVDAIVSWREAEGWNLSGNRHRSTLIGTYWPLLLVTCHR